MKNLLEEKINEHVSCGTFEKLEIFENLVKTWNEKINLVSRQDVSALWTRHIVNSAALYRFVKNSRTIIDLGSGAGFPGIVLSILGVKNAYLVESNFKKSLFLKEASKISDNNIYVLNERIEKIHLEDYSGVIVSRAFAKIGEILSLTKSTDKEYFLLKGIKASEEISEALKLWDFEYKIDNFSDEYVVNLKNVRPKNH